jgi:hypothetical protein
MGGLVVVATTVLRPEWTGEHVCDLFIKARRAFSGRAFMVSGGVPGAAQGAELTPIGIVDVPMPPGPLKVMHWFNRYLTEHEKPLIREWLRVKVGAGGMSLRETVDAHPSWGRQGASREARWKWYNRQRAALCERVAADLRLRGVPWFDLDPEGHVIGEDGNVITLA